MSFGRASRIVAPALGLVALLVSVLLLGASATRAAVAPPSEAVIIARIEANRVELGRAMRVYNESHKFFDAGGWTNDRARVQITAWRIDSVEFDRVFLDVAFSQDGSVTKAYIQEVSRMVNDDDYKDFLLGARGALMACSPFDLPADKFEIWRRFTLRFLPQGPA